MRLFRPLAVTALALGVLAPPALARPTSLSVTPAKPLATDTLTLTARAPGGAPSGRRYALAITTRAGGACQSFALARPVGVADPGDRITVDLVPRTDGAWTGWCTGSAVVSLLRREAGGGWIPVAGARRVFRIKRTPKLDPHELFGTKVLIDVLPTSTATVTLPGHADRVLGLGGSINGFIPGKHVLNTAYAINLTGGDLAVRSLITDPVCTSGTFHPLAPLAPIATSDPAKLTFDTAGAVSGALGLAADPATLAGCAGPETGTTTLELSGKLDALKLADVTLAAKTFLVPVGGGNNATVNVVLHLKINILD